MVRKRSPVLLRSVEDRADARELRTAIAAELGKVPMNEFTLRLAVDTFVQAECRTGVPPAIVISRLATLVEDAEITPTAARLRLARCLILWCVDSYFGQVGGDAPAHVQRRSSASATAS
jgi:hypothetical protein